MKRLAKEVSRSFSRPFRAYLPSASSGGGPPYLTRSTHGGPSTTAAASRDGVLPHVQEKKVVSNYYKNMYDSLMEMYSTSEGAGGVISVTSFIDDLLATGLRSDDPRLKGTLGQLQSEADSGLISKQSFMEAVSPNMPLIETALRGKFVIPEFSEFTEKIHGLYEDCKAIKGGEMADYIPELARVDPNLWGVSLCTINGQRYSTGDSSANFTVQSGSKCFIYGIAVEEYDHKYIHQFIGKEPSGLSFNSLTLNSEMKPHNPMINAGAMVLASLIKPNESMTERTNFILQKFCEMAGVPNRSIKCDIITCDSEMETAHRNYALLHYMKDMKVFPGKVDIEEILKLYTRICSVELDCERGAVMAATLANGGQCPITGTRVLSKDTICHTLSLMHSCGMYDSAGEFSFAIGLPAKSGVSGVILLVVPNVMGVCLYNPLVNKNGNSVKGLHFCQRLVDTFNFHGYDSLVPDGDKVDPRRKKGEHRELEVTSVMYAAQAGALSTLQRYKMDGMDLSVCNYDGRTPLHVAAAEGHYHVMELLLDCPNCSVNTTDRWSCTALDEALHFGHHDIANLLRERGGIRGHERA